MLERLERVEREVRTRDGRWHLMRALPYRTAEDRIEGVVLTFVDITERRRIEERLRNSEARLSAIVEQSAAGIASLSVDGTFTFVNAKLASLLGYAHESLIGHALIDLVAETHRPELRERFTSLTRDGAAFQIVAPLLAKNGAATWTNLTASAIRDAAGAVQSTVIVLVDVSETRRAEAASRLSDDRLRLVVDSITEYFILTLDQHGYLDSWTGAAARAFGYTEAEAIGQHVSLVFTEEDRKEGVPEQELQVARERGFSSDDRWHVRKDGSRLLRERDGVSASRRGRHGDRIRQDRAGPHRAQAVRGRAPASARRARTAGARADRRARAGESRAPGQRRAGARGCCNGW